MSGKVHGKEGIVQRHVSLMVVTLAGMMLH
jgi:hypothetical protein